MRVEPKVVSFRSESSVVDTKEETSVEAPKRSVARDVVARPVRATRAFIDTMVGKSEPVVEKAEFVCSGIILVQTGNMCILNGSVRYVGDMVNGKHICQSRDRCPFLIQSQPRDNEVFCQLIAHQDQSSHGRQYPPPDP